MTTERVPEADLHLRMLSQPRLLAGVRAMMTMLAERAGFDQVDSGNVALAVDEALANVIRHGYERREDAPIEIRVWLLTGDHPGIRVMIEDEGRQVDPSQIQSRDLDDIRPGGLGVHLMQQIMHTCRFEQREREGMRVVLEKHVPADATNDDESND